MRSKELNQRIRASLSVLVGSADELRGLDQALGDGDLGITIAAGSGAVIRALEKLPAESAPKEIAKACAQAFANANPSTMAALVAGALLAGSREWGDTADVTVEDAHAFVAAGATSIAQRGKAKAGDKTILDGLIAVQEALKGQRDAKSAIDSAVVAAAGAVESTKNLQSRRGRASWLQERSIGLPDPGATALLRFVEAWRSTAAGDTR